MKLPVNPNQKFQIGDICKIVRADNSFRYPPLEDEETTGYGCLIVIMYSYAQCFPNIGPRNTDDFSVCLPNWLNPHKFDKRGYFKGDFIAKNELEWAWVSEMQLEFVRKPTEEEIEKIIAIGEKTTWKKYKKEDECWIWDSYQDLLEHCQEKIEMRISK